VPKDAGELELREALELIRHIQTLLWLDMDPVGDYWNPDKEWSPGSDFIQAVADTMTTFGLRPEKLYRPVLTNEGVNA
jgi:hypothetical protein